VSFDRAHWKEVAILPFTGDEPLTDPAALEFASRLRTLASLRITAPREVAPTVRRLGINPPTVDDRRGHELVEIGISIQQAQQVGRALDAHAVLIGTVRVFHTSGGSNGLCMVRLIDVSSGEVVATRSNSTGTRLGLSERDCAVRAAADVGTAIREVLEAR
jgi:hypothetical protein